MARPADDGALGHRGSGRGRGQRYREGGRLRHRLPVSEKPHRRVHKPAAAQHRSSLPRHQAARYRPHGRRVIRSGEGRLMPPFDLSRRLAAEALGTALLVATVVGSGIMAETLTRDVALALLGNTLPTGAILVVLITILGPISGAHFNPAVSLVFVLKRELSVSEGLLYAVAQVIGGIAGTVLAHAMFALPLIDLSLKERSGTAQ